MTRVATVRVGIASAILLLLPSGGFAQGAREHLAAAIEKVEHNCGDDVSTFCSKVTRGEGRLLLCMQAHEDQLSRRCQLTLYRSSRKLEAGVNRVAQTADACWSDIEANCGDADKIGQCLVQKRASLSNACRSTLEVVQKAVHGVMSLRGMQVYSADDKSVGHVTNVERGPDDKLQSIDVALGPDKRVVRINADKFEELAERVKLRLQETQIQSLPEMHK